MGDNRPLRYLEPTPTELVEAGDPAETVVYRASSLGACPRAVVACALGLPAAPHPAWLQEVFDEGTDAEPVTSAMWDERTGIATVDQQQEIELELGEMHERRVIVRGHIDGASDCTDRVLREYKKIRESGWDDFCRRGIEVNAHYPWQVGALMLAGGFTTAEFVGGRFVERADDGVVQETGRVGTPQIAEVHPHVIHQPPVNLLAIRKRIMAWEDLIAVGFAAGEVTCDRSMYPCPWFREHDPDPETDEIDLSTVGAVAGLDAAAVQQATDAMLMFVAAKDAETAAKAEMERHRKTRDVAAGKLRDVLDRVDNGQIARKITVAGGGTGAGRVETVTLRRKQYHVNERTQTVKAHDVDYFQVVAAKKPGTGGDE